MLETLQSLLLNNPALGRTEIAKITGFDKKEISKTLHANKKIFSQSKGFHWYSSNNSLFELKLNTGWLTSNSFESTLQSTGSPLTSRCDIVIIEFPKKIKILLEATARILALCNQLSFEKKIVILKFLDKSTYSYLDRVGFFEQLDTSIIVRPQLPDISRSKTYKGGTTATVEFGEIDLNTPNDNLPKQLKESFIANAGKKYSSPAFTILSELFSNVIRHSNSQIPGFIALQSYKNSKSPHLQTVISDSGEGIIGTLKPVLGKEYKSLSKKYDLTKNSDCISLILEMFNEGGISRKGCDNGTGLKVSADMAAKYDAKISVRQESFEVKLFYKNGVFDTFSSIENMPLIKGTHICFDFFLTN